MRSHEVFQQMTPEEAGDFLEVLREESPAIARVALGAAAEAFKLRRQFLMRQPRARQADWVRRALSRPGNAAAAEEVLADFFLESEKELLIELLDALGIEHEDGSLAQENPPCPSKRKLGAAVKKFRAGKESKHRELLLRAFAAQSAIDWPDFEALL
jgi:hypothetical protein